MGVLGVVTTSKKDGGLGISKMADVNMALMAKWAWRFTVEKNSFWRKVIEAIHGGRGNWCFLPLNKSITGCWKTIAAFLRNVTIQGKKFHQLIRAVVGNGEEVCFWTDHWFGSVVLKDRWLCLYKLERKKKCNIKDRIQ